MDSLKDLPDHHDADLILRLYELRREPTMRHSRDAMREFLPVTATEACEVLAKTHPLNAAWRQTTTYWEMVYGMARHGIVHPGYLLENSVEGLLLFAKVEPWLKELRAASSPRTMQNAEWAATRTDAGRRLMEELRARVTKARSARAS